jgi:hypothetical protein
LDREDEDLVASCCVVRVGVRAVSKDAVLGVDRDDLACAYADEGHPTLGPTRLFDGESAGAPAKLHERYAGNEELSLERVLRHGKTEERLVTTVAKPIASGRLLVSDSARQIRDAVDRVEHDGAISDSWPDELSPVVAEGAEELAEPFEVERHA